MVRPLHVLGATPAPCAAEQGQREHGSSGGDQALRPAPPFRDRGRVALLAAGPLRVDAISRARPQDKPLQLRCVLLLATHPCTHLPHPAAVREKEECRRAMRHPADGCCGSAPTVCGARS